MAITKETLMATLLEKGSSSREAEMLASISGITVIPDVTVSGGKAAAPAGPTLEELKEKEEKEYQERVDALGTNQILFSQCTNGRLPASGIDYVIEQYDEEHWAEEFRSYIPQVDPFYVWDCEVLEYLLLGSILGENVLLHGYPGTGKTSAVKQFAAILRQPYAKFSGNGGIETSSFLGCLLATKEIITLADGTQSVVPVMEYKEGMMPVCVREGFLCTIDEVMKLAPDVQMALQSLYEKRGFLMLPDKPGTIEDKQVERHADFKMYCTDNTCGVGDNMALFSASQVQDTSTLDRFGLTVYVDYLPFDDEVNMICAKFPAADKRTVGRAVRFAGLVRNSYKHGDLPVTLSPRGLEVIAGLISRGLPLEAALKPAYLNKVGDEVNKSVAIGLMESV